MNRNENKKVDVRLWSKPAILPKPPVPRPPPPYPSKQEAFSRIAGHNVEVSSTMIKVTYNKVSPDVSPFKASDVVVRPLPDNLGISFSTCATSTPVVVRKSVEEDEVQVIKVVQTPPSKIIKNNKSTVDLSASTSGTLLKTTKSKVKPIEEKKTVTEKPDQQEDTIKKLRNKLAMCMEKLNEDKDNLNLLKMIEKLSVHLQNQQKKKQKERNGKQDEQKERKKPGPKKKETNENLMDTKLVKENKIKTEAGKDGKKRKVENMIKTRIISSKVKKKTDINGRKDVSLKKLKKVNKIKELKNVSKISPQKSETSKNVKLLKDQTRPIVLIKPIETEKKKKIMFNDPSLPPGWKRVIRYEHNQPVAKYPVLIISPEGRKFWDRSHLKLYLEKNKSTFKAEDFSFCLYERKKTTSTESTVVTNSDITPKKMKSPSKEDLKDKKKEMNKSETSVSGSSFSTFRDDNPASSESDEVQIIGETIHKAPTSTTNEDTNEIMFDDPQLPTGWKRIIHVRSQGDSEGKVDVWLISPEGKTFKSRGPLQKHLEDTKSNLTIEKFYFGVHPRGYKRKLKKKNEKEEQTVKKKKKMHGDVRILSEGTTDPSRPPNLKRMTVDPNLPPGWKRIIRLGPKADKDRVIIVNPEGKKFHAKKLLEDYLIEIKSELNISQFDFSLHGKDSKIRQKLDQIVKEKKKEKRKNEEDDDGDKEDSTVCEVDNKENSKHKYNLPIMFDDPKLPAGWRRVLHRREKGESEGRYDVHVIDPSGKKFVRRGALEEYLCKTGSDLSIDDFDFTVCGRQNNKNVSKSSSTNNSYNVSAPKKVKLTGLSQDRPIPSIMLNDKIVPETREGQLINQVSGLAIHCGVSTLRAERRIRVPKSEHEKVIKQLLEEENTDSGDCIPGRWIKLLTRCRSEFGGLEDEAVSEIASATQLFVQKFAQATLLAGNGDNEVIYDNVVDVVENNESLSVLETLIPRKITLKQFHRYNRPTQFTSFT